MRQGSRMPEIALPFAVVGAAAGWLSADLLANPVVLDAGCNRGLAAASAAAVTAAVGRSLTRRFGVSTMWAADRSATWVPLVGSISLAGVITGARARHHLRSAGLPRAQCPSRGAHQVPRGPVLAVLGAELSHRRRAARVGPCERGATESGVRGLSKGVRCPRRGELQRVLPDGAAGGGPDERGPAPGDSCRSLTLRSYSLSFSGRYLRLALTDGSVARRVPASEAPETASGNDIGMIHVQRDNLRRTPLLFLKYSLRLLRTGTGRRAGRDAARSRSVAASHRSSS